MRYLLILALALAISALLSTDASAEPEVYMVEINPDTVDNQQQEDVTFNADCTVCNGEGLTYYYWNSSIDGVLSSGSDEHNIMLSSTEFSVGEHTVTFQVRDNNSEWSVINDNSRATLTVSGRDGGGGDSSITVNFEIVPPTLHLGDTATFRSCSVMQPEPQPCVDDPDANLDFYWEVLWNDEGDWSYIGNQESFDTTNLQEGTHTVKLSITYQGDTANATQQMIVLPPIPIAVIDYVDGGQVKEGEILTINARCLDNNQNEISCEYFWEIWDNDGNPDLLFELTGSSISLTNLTNDMGSYEILLKTKDTESGIVSLYTNIIVNVLPPNVAPSASISISPDSLGGLTPEYYQYSVLTFSSSSSDPDGNIVSFKWYFNNEVISEESQFSEVYNETGIYQIKLEVQDDNGAWSSKKSSNFKIIPNTAPTVDFDYTVDGSRYTFNSSATDSEGHISSYNWSINGMSYSSEENITWTANKTGTYTVSLEVIDDGGMKSVVSKDIDVKIAEMKNFVAIFSSKNIEVGGNFEIDFSQTTGEFDYFEIKVLYPNGTSMKYTVKDKSSNFSLGFDKAGTYPIDVKVIWMDGLDRGLDDFYGPTVNVGQDGSNSGGGSETEEISTDSSDALPAASLLVSILLVSIIAVSRRQR
ncbi:MAG: PKD domain-containing protein [Candidatus Thermoplasmatota archaeon]|nr:PKD domain-containing protein [Candidatus Thermoplasmatota archaeon]